MKIKGFSNKKGISSVIVKMALAVMILVVFSFLVVTGVQNFRAGLEDCNKT